MDVEYWLNGIWFQWNRRKATTNLRDHGVAFEDACEVFFDPFIRWLDSELVKGAGTGAHHRHDGRLATADCGARRVKRRGSPHLGSPSYVGGEARV